MSLDGLDGKVAVVTGGAGGIGSAVARRLSAEGASVVVVDLDAAAAAATAEALPGPGLGLADDVSDHESAARIVRATVERFGRLDLAHLNAGYPGTYESIAATSIEEFDRVIAVNVRGVFIGLKAILAQFERQGTGGSVVATSSGLGKMGAANLAPYTAAKHAVLGLVRSAALEVAPRGVRVNGLLPGYIDTQMMRSAEAASGLDGAAVREGIETTIPLGRYGTPDEMAAAVAWLLSDEASYVTGAAFEAEGGVLAAAGGFSAPAEG